jgi:hypothetical protein
VVCFVDALVYAKALCGGFSCHQPQILCGIWFRKQAFFRSFCVRIHFCIG